MDHAKSQQDLEEAASTEKAPFEAVRAGSTEQPCQDLQAAEILVITAQRSQLAAQKQTSQPVLQAPTLRHLAGC